MGKLKGRTWAAKRGLLRAESRPPGKFSGSKAAATPEMLWKGLVSHTTKAYPTGTKDDHFLTLWIKAQISNPVSLLPSRAMPNHLKNICNVICHLIALQAPSET